MGMALGIVSYIVVQYIPAVGLYNTTLSGSANAVAVHPTF